jgi:hypothetical protein
VGVETDERAVCRYNPTPTNFASMIGFDRTGGIQHTKEEAGLQDDQNYLYYVQCRDEAGNLNSTDYLINFSVGSYSNGGADTTPPIRSSGLPSGTLSSGTTSTTISLSTNENATCKYDTTSTTYSLMANTFSTTGTTSHSQLITGLSNGQTYTYYVRCEDILGNENTNDFMISFSVSSGVSPTILLQENFEDGNLASRGWYDAPSAVISTTEHVSGSTGSMEFHFNSGAQRPVSRLARHSIAESDSVYLSYWVKYSDNWVGSNRNYHPHDFHFFTNEDPSYLGPAYSFLTTYTEMSYYNGQFRPRMALQDAKNIDADQINVNLVGITEDRAVCGCNGVPESSHSDMDYIECYGCPSSCYNAKVWTGPSVLERGKWHFVESYFQLNSVTGGIGQPDGIIRLWIDGNLVINHDDVYLRTGIHPDMMFNQFVGLPYIGDGSPVAQTFWVDNITVATGRV